MKLVSRRKAAHDLSWRPVGNGGGQTREVSRVVVDREWKSKLKSSRSRCCASSILIPPGTGDQDPVTPSMSLFSSDLKG
ncbi:hypothetical protein OPQ81_000292 [Rhizoctonia solani]|nr:hypothetical protein OPQ81_000292 [Rhizoctonia solani]